MKRLRLLPLLLTAAMLFGCAAGPETDGAARIAAPKAAAVRGMKKDGSSVGEREKLSEGYRTRSRHSVRVLQGKGLARRGRKMRSFPGKPVFCHGGTGGHGGRKNTG